MEQPDSELFVYWIKIAFRICGSVFDAEDVVQRSCLELLQKHVDPLDEKQGGLMHRVICCRATDVVRQRRHSEQLSEIVVASSAPPDCRIQEEECVALLREGLARLPKRQGDVFAMRYLSEFSLSQIALSLDCSENSVSVQLSKAKQTLQKYFEECYGYQK